MIIFENSGEMDIRGATIMGLHAKESDTAVGFFGTGLKYAIAICARLHVPMEIYVGTKKYTFTTREAIFRGSAVDLIYMLNPDGTEQELAFTTSYGKNWTLAQAYRELYANAKDEGGEIYSSSTVTPQSGKTCIVVHGSDIEQAHANRHDVVLETEVLCRNSYANLHVGNTSHIYYRNYAVYIPQAKPMYCWNINPTIDLTEDRTAKYAYIVDTFVGNAIVALTDKDLLKQILTSELCYEAQLSTSYINAAPPEVFSEVMNDLLSTRMLEISKNWLDYYNRHQNFETKLTPHIMTAREQNLLQRACVFVTTMGYKCSPETVNVVSGLGVGVYGMTSKNRIYISKFAFDAGCKQLVITLLEEIIHSVKGFEDCSRSFQDYLLTELVSAAEEKQCQYL